MQNFKERIFLFVQATGVSTREFERNCGLANGTISAIGAQGPTAIVLKKIADTYTALNLNWLFRGNGDMLLSEKTDTLQALNDIHDNSTVNINYGALKDVIVEAIKEAKL